MTYPYWKYRWMYTTWKRRTFLAVLGLPIILLSALWFAGKEFCVTITGGVKEPTKTWPDYPKPAPVVKPPLGYTRRLDGREDRRALRDELPPMLPNLDTNDE